MTTDRSIRLDVSVPRPGAGPADPQTSGQPGRQAQPDAQDSDRFSRAMAGAPPSAPPGAGPGLPPPMSLFGPARAASPTRGDPSPPALAERLDLALSRLMVGEGRSGGQQVRMELNEDLMPGVTVSIEEVEGRLQVDFLCRNETSRLRLAAAAPLEAPLLAQRLRRDVLLRVQADDPDDPQLFEVGAAP